MYYTILWYMYSISKICVHVNKKINKLYYVYTVYIQVYMYVHMYSWIAHVRNFHCQEFPQQSKIVTYL